jgi:hypothetical protein
LASLHSTSCTFKGAVRKGREIFFLFFLQWYRGFLDGEGLELEQVALLLERVEFDEGGLRLVLSATVAVAVCGGSEMDHGLGDLYALGQEGQHDQTRAGLRWQAPEHKPRRRWRRARATAVVVRPPDLLHHDLATYIANKLN